MNETRPGEAHVSALLRGGRSCTECLLIPTLAGSACIIWHTFGRRLRTADVPEEDRKALLGHTVGCITSFYSAAELTKLTEYASRIAATETRSPTLTILKRRVA